MPSPIGGRDRRGLSVVEVLVALVLLTVGLLAVAGSSALALRTSLDASRRRHAAHRVASRFALLQASGCTGIVAGSDAGGSTGVTERWSVVTRTASHVIVTDSMSWMAARGPVRRALTTAIEC